MDPEKLLELLLQAMTETSTGDEYLFRIDSSERNLAGRLGFHLLDRYVTEQVFPYNNRSTKDNPLHDGDRFALAVSQISGKRLTYAELTGKVGETSF
jgi:hypothetical protein